jgi:hypothetical protein
LYWSVSDFRVVSWTEPNGYHTVIGTGDVTLSRASTGHGGSDARGVVVVVAIVGGVVGGSVLPGAAVTGTTVVVAGGGSLPASRIDLPEAQAANTTHAARARAARFIL